MDPNLVRHKRFAANPPRRHSRRCIFSITCFQAATRLLWVDELITLGIARQGSLSAIWHALALGADPNPPLTHAAVLLSTRLFGQSALAIRVPSILAMLLTIVALWSILRRWLQPTYAALGVLAFMATRGFDYAYEARSYAALTGFSLAALAFWLSSTPAPARATPPARPESLIGMALCLAAALSSNYYGVLAWFPIATRRSRPHRALTPPPRSNLDRPRHSRLPRWPSTSRSSTTT